MVVGLIGIWYSMKNIGKFDMLMCISIVAITVIFCNIIFYIIISLSNNYKRKQFIKIKETGIYHKGIILTASYQFPGYARNSWLVKNAGKISVEANNKIYTIEDLDYNNEFKLLESSLDNHFNANDLSTFKNTQVEIDIYVLDNKAVADLESIKIENCI